MIQQPIENLFLETRKTMLLHDLSNLTVDRRLLQEIEEYANPGRSLVGIITDTLLPGSALRLKQENELRHKLTIGCPGALDKFNELASVCNRIATLKSPVIVY